MINTQHILGLDSSHLVDCQQGHKLQYEVARAFRQMQNAAQSEGIDCQIASSYRSFEQQKLIWQKKWRGDKVLRDINEKILPFATLNDTNKLAAILTWSALPGASRHHWGTDLDVYDQQTLTSRKQSLHLVQTEYTEATGPCFALNQWLTANAATYGFNRPYVEYKGGVAPEPWHLSYAKIANEISQNFKLEALRDALSEAKLDGLELILTKIDDIYQRYILNRGQQ